MEDWAKSKFKTQIGFIKYRWHFEIYCLKSNVVIGRSHKRFKNGTFFPLHDFFSPGACGCSSCSVLSNLINDKGLTIHDVAVALAVFKGVHV